MFSFGKTPSAVGTDGANDVEKMTVEPSSTTKWRGMLVSFNDVCYEVPSHKNKKETVRLLTNVNGYLAPGQMTCLMGPSGCGKTTLLDLLAGRKTVGTITGDILYGGEKPSKAFLRRYTGYVEQFDTLLPILTPYEMLLYTAELKLPTSVPLEEKKHRVERVIRKLGLQQCRDVRIGSVFARGISGGQAKRVNIGIALVAEPRVLFLDEPTSGLDSYTSYEVMSVVKNVAQSGITVCATIHSPTANTFKLFDSLLMLMRGRPIYFGPLGKPAMDYFTGVGKALGSKRFETGDNPAEWLVGMTTSANEDMDKITRLADSCTDSELYRTQIKARDDLLRQLQSTDQDSDGMKQEMEVARKVQSSTEVGFFKALQTFFKFRTARNLKDGEFLGPRVMDKVIVAFLIATLYYGTGHKTHGTNGIANTAAVLFMWCTMPGFGASSYVPAITLERALYIRERNDGLYTPVTYLFWKVVEELCVAIPTSMGVSCLVYFPLELGGSFAVFYFTYLVSLSIGIILAYAVASASPNMDVANAALPAYVVTLLFFGGFLIRFPDMPRGWIWYSKIDFIRYGWTALMTNEFKDNKEIFLANMTVLEYYQMADCKSSHNVGYLVIFFGVFAVLAWLALRFINHQKR